MTKESCYLSVTVNEITAKVTNNFQETELHHFTTTPPWILMMTDARVVKGTVTTNDNSASQDYISFPYIPKINPELFQKYSSHTSII